ncbi:ABC transporter ATP-binding protein [Lamprobacter modestohalophilus]|uniref:ABC transporter ATP-binding protein n=1 Tax=Lamprobacter modestohalophilus TaxID=1064514 RepID=UPI002ADEE2DF|nr:ABC transporter ATP-binding protein [Lamprobacter modestohalophilus]MEA1052046.1 ABC transporter ATP-binding protein [Lamprobacter modestohalophilus]
MAEPLSAPEPWQDPRAAPYVRIERVTKRFGEVYAVDDLSLNIYRGEFFSLLGGSGCGKSTLLRLLAGLERPTSGRIFIDGADVTNLPAYARPVNMMFQSYALFPHMNVEQNVAFGLKQEGMPRHQRGERVGQMLDLLQIGELRRRKPDQLSGGQRQRVALARSLAKQPKLLLLDEPLGALDKRLRESTQFELVNLQERLGITFVTVTHDQEEAMTMSTRIAVMRAGQILQVDTPTAIYEYPNCQAVARFIGSVNLFPGKVVAVEGNQVRVASQLGPMMQMQAFHPFAIGTPVSVAVRPEKMRPCSPSTLGSSKPVLTASAPDVAGGQINRLAGVVEDIAYLGDVSIYRVRVQASTPAALDAGATTLASDEGSRLDSDEGARLGTDDHVRLSADDDARLSADANARSVIVEMTLTNVQPRTEQALTWGQPVTMEWSPTSGAILTD